MGKEIVFDYSKTGFISEEENVEEHEEHRYGCKRCPDSKIRCRQ